MAARNGLSVKLNTKAETGYLMERCSFSVEDYVKTGKAETNGGGQARFFVVERIGGQVNI